MISKIVALMILILVLATATVYTQSVATNATGVKGGTPCAHPGDVGQHNPVTKPTMTIFVCDD